MAALASSPRAYPKRKRAEVSYYEDFSDASETEDDEHEEVVVPIKKKAKVPEAKPLPKKKILPFMTLPAELRNKIYAFALTDPDDIFLISKSRQYRRTVQIARPSEASHLHRRGRWGRSWLYNPPSTPSPSTTTPTRLASFAPGILVLNKQIHDEALPFLYGSNIFAPEDTMALHAFCATIGARNCAFLREIRIKGWGHSKAHTAMNHPAFVMLTNALNLTRLSIDCKFHWGTPQQFARQIYRVAHNWFEALAAVKGNKEAGLDILDVGDENINGMYGGYQAPKTAQQKIQEFNDELRKLLHA